MNKQPLAFNTAFMYPFNRWKGMLNIFWIFVPVLGWFLVGGYTVRIVKEFVKGNYKELPELDFGPDVELGFFMFLKSLPFLLAYMVAFGLLGWVVVTVSSEEYMWIVSIIETLLAILAFPMLFINFMKKETIGSLFEFEVIKPVFEHFGDYILMLLKSIGLGLIFLMLYLVLIGIPANAFSKNIFAADFYRRRVA